MRLIRWLLGPLRPAPRRTSSWWCTMCGWVLTDEVAEIDEIGFYHYRCPSCGAESTWDMDAPAPLCLRAEARHD